MLARLIASALFLAAGMWSPALIARSDIPDLTAKDVLLLPPEALATFTWDSRPESSVTIEDLQETIEEHDPLRFFVRAFRVLRHAAQTEDNELLTAVREKLDWMLTDYEFVDIQGHGRRWTYGYQFQQLQPGWWSGMDGLLAPLVYWLLADLTGDENYRKVALDTAHMAIRSPRDGGVLWTGEDGCWVSEYTWEGIEPEQEYHVMNGHLFGTQALLILASLTGDDRLADAYRCARQGTEARADEHFAPLDTWTYYQTDPKVISASHYLLYEVAEFRSLSKLTNDDFYAEQAERRIDVFARHFPISVAKTAKGYEAVVAAIGAPNPYWPDNYPLRLTCEGEGWVKEQEFSDVYNTNIPLHLRLVPEMEIPSYPNNCTYEVVRGGGGLPLFTQDVFEVIGVKDQEQEQWNPVASHDATGFENGALTIEPDSAEHGEARATIQLSRNLDLRDMIAITATSDHDMTMSALLIDADGSVAHRYYPKIVTGCDNLILLSKVGFTNYEDLGEEIESLTLRFYTQDLTAPTSVKLSRFSILSDQLQVKDYIEGDNLCLNQQ